MKKNSPRAVIEDARSNDNLFVSRNFEALILAATIILTSLGFSICFALLHVAITAPERISVIFYGVILLVIFCQFIGAIVFHYTQNLIWWTKLRKLRKTFFAMFEKKGFVSRNYIFIAVFVAIMINLIVYKILYLRINPIMSLISVKLIH